MIGWYGNSTANNSNAYIDLIYAFYFHSNGNLYIYEDGNNPANVTGSIPGGFTMSTWYDCKIILKASGADYYVKKQSASNYTLVYSSVYSTEK